MASHRDALAVGRLLEVSDVVLGILSAVVSLGLPVLLVVLLVRAARGGVRGPVDPRSVRRFFQYLLLYALGLVAASGVVDLLGQLLAPALVEDRTVLARALTFTTLGIPLVVVLALRTRRLLVRPGEREALGWTVLMTAAPLTALALAVAAVAALLGDLLAGRSLRASDGVGAVVWAALWLVTWRLGADLAPARRTVHLVLGSALGLVVGVVGLVELLAEAVRLLLLPAGAGVLGERQGLADAGALLAAAAPVWWWYWYRHLRTADRGPAWLVYVLPFAVGGSTVLAVVGASTALHDLLVWFLGDPRATELTAHLAGTPVAAAAAVVGALSWWYHRRVLAVTAREEVARVHEYLLTAIALVAAAAGLTLLLVGAAEAVGPVGPGVRPVNTFLSAATLVAVGGGLWAVLWGATLQRVRSSPVERAAPTRRVFLGVVIGVSGLVAVVALLGGATGLVDQLLRDGGSVLRALVAARVPAALVLVGALVGGYHVAVLQHDRGILPAAPARERRTRTLLLLGPVPPDAAREVRGRTGARVEVLADGGAPWTAAEVLGSLTGASGDTLVVERVEGALRARAVTRYVV